MCNNFSCPYRTLYGNCSITGCINHDSQDNVIIFPQTIGNITFYNKHELFDYIISQQKNQYQIGRCLTMTEQEARILIEGYLGDDEVVNTAIEMAGKALEEIQQYRAVGTVKEIKIREAQSVRLAEGYLTDLTALREYQEIGTPDACRENKDFLDFLYNQINPNDMEMYLSMYHSINDKSDRLE